MFAVYGRGRWMAFLSPQLPYESHIACVYYTPMEGIDNSLPECQQMIGWAPEKMLESMISYVNERFADDEDEMVK